VGNLSRFHGAVRGYRHGVGWVGFASIRRSLCLLYLGDVNTGADEEIVTSVLTSNVFDTCSCAEVSEFRWWHFVWLMGREYIGEVVRICVGVVGEQISEWRG